MASTFKTFTNSDLTNSRSLMHEAIPMKGTLLSGSYGVKATVTGSEPHIKTYSHGMFQSVYDYPHVSSSANHLFDMTFGFKTGSYSGGTYTEGNSTVDTQGSKKLNVYNQLSQILVGYDKDGNLRKFDKDGIFSGTPAADHSDKIGDVVALCFSRLLIKDEIKKGSFSMTLGVHEDLPTAFDVKITIADTGAATNFRSNSPAGEYGFLKAADLTSNAIDGSATDAQKTVGLIYYQAGIVVLDYTKIFSKPANPASAGSNKDRDGILNATTCAIAGDSVFLTEPSSQGTTIIDSIDKHTIDKVCSAFRSRIFDLRFNNTTELNSTIYYCRANHNEFNYSSNATYLTGSQIRIKEQKSDMPRSYATTIGLYSADNELLATAKLSEPLRKDPTNELFLRVRLDY